MASIAKNGVPSYASLLIPANDKITGLYCGEDIAAGDACYVKSDGKIWRSSGAAANAAAKIDGYAAMDAHVAQNDALTLIRRATWQYGSGLTPGARYYLSGTTAGGLVDAASTGGTVPCGYAVDTTRVYLFSTP
jgi:hypothetical protein